MALIFDCSVREHPIFVCVQSLLASIICSAVLGLVTGPALGYRRYVGAVYRLTPRLWSPYCFSDGSVFGAGMRCKRATATANAFLAPLNALVGLDVRVVLEPRYRMACIRECYKAPIVGMSMSTQAEARVVCTSICQLEATRSVRVRIAGLACTGATFMGLGN